MFDIGFLLPVDIARLRPPLRPVESQTSPATVYPLCIDNLTGIGLQLWETRATTHG
jgi:hypothetical protein